MAARVRRRARIVTRVEIVRLIIDERRDEQAVVLRDAKRRAFPIAIGIFEATAIDRILKEKKAERPLTHDLIAGILEALGARLLRVEIDDLKGDVFYAKLKLRRADGEESTVDCRPSDAIAIALRDEVPIYVSEDVIARAARPE
jgi:bifunctional DNase/RNase